MKRLTLAACLSALFVLAGCLTAPVASSGGPGSVTVPNTNATAIISAAQDVFPQYGYTLDSVNYPDSISFDKPSGTFGKIMYGSYGTTTTIRVHLKLAPIAGTNDFRVIPRVTRVSDAGEAGFEDSTRMMGLWAGQFGPLLQKVKAEAGGAGPM
ncbi:MAG: hypothetical protein PHC88_05975 [Terrimicrobiaceae bacterium]|nr:hypothetical protein [Terrimicrobiaceae bacterium]